MSISTRLVEKEPLLNSNNGRLALFPIQYPDIWDMYKKAQGSIWTAEEINFKEDLADWDNLDDDTKVVVKTVLAFFFGADAIVNDNLAEKFLRDIDILEIKFFYRFQLHIEDVHNEVYSQMIDNLIKDGTEKNKLLNAIHTMPGVSKLYHWAQTWIHRSPETELKENQILVKYETDDLDEETLTDLATIWCFAKRLVAFACVEGIMFSGAFAIIYWLKERGVLPGLTFSNELISRDEGMHMRFACYLYQNYIEEKPPQEQVQAIIMEATLLSQELISGCMKRMTGMNSSDMNQYLEFVADSVSTYLGYNTIHQAKNPFQFMDKTAIGGLTNFFERKVGEYSVAGFEEGETENIVLDDDY
jgi:ribonucleotide reductase beta subunit family protein with ferritin-like domain